MKLSRATLVRRGWIVPLCMILVVVAAAIIAATRTSTYRTEAVLVVPSNGGPSNTSGTPIGTLATTYAQLITEDYGVIDTVAHATGLPPAVVAGRIGAVQIPNTSIVDVTYSDPSAHRCGVGAQAIVAAVTGAHPSAATIPAGALRLVSSPGAPSQEGRKVPGGPVPIGLVLGLFLGVAVLIAWDRQDARVDKAAVVEQVLGVPVTELGTDPVNGSLGAAQERWRRLIDRTGGGTVALVSATPSSDGAARALEEGLSKAGSAGSVAYRATDAGGRGADGELVAMHADLVVLVASRGDRLREIRRTVHDLHQLGIEPAWTILGESP